MNVNEYGIVFYLNTSYVMTAFTSLSLAITRPDASVLTVTNPAVSVGLVNLTTPNGTYLANQYIKYTLASGDITLAGTYTVRLTYLEAGIRLISDVVTFTVNP